MEDDDSDDDSSPAPAVKVGKTGQVLSNCGRPAFKSNTINKKYNNNYRNPENTNKVGGKLYTLGRAVGLAAMVLFGYDVSLEDAAVKDRQRIFLSAAYYALTDEEISEVMASDEVTLSIYIKNLVIALIRVYKYEAADAMRKTFQEEVFGPTMENAELQKHLNLQPGQRIHAL